MVDGDGHRGAHECGVAAEAVIAPGEGDHQMAMMVATPQGAVLVISGNEFIGACRGDENQGWMKDECGYL